MKKLLLLAVISVGSYFGWHALKAPGHVATAAADDKLLADRVWIDHLPRDQRDTFNIFAVLTEQPIGLFQATSQWRGNHELFRYEAHGGELRVVYPQTGDRETLRAKARTCKEGGMDYCLELAGGSRGVKRYYSQEGWEIGSLDAERALVKSLER